MAGFCCDVGGRASSSLAATAQSSRAPPNTAVESVNYHSVDYNRLENRRSMQLGHSTVENHLSVGPASYAGERRCSEPAKRRNSGLGPRVSSGADNPVFEVPVTNSVVMDTDTTQPHSVI